MSKCSEDDFINFMNELYYQNIDDINTLQSINTYKRTYNNKPNDLLKWIDNDNVIFNHSDRKYIIESAKQVIENNFKNYSNLVNVAKNYLFKKVIITGKLRNPLIDLQYENLLSNKKYNILGINNYYDIKDFEKINDDKESNNNKKYRYRSYNNMISNKDFNSTLIFYSYICYFKCAVNCIIHHPIFKNKLNVYSDVPPEFEYYDKNKRYSFAEYLQIGGNQLWDMLQKDEDILNIVEFYNNMTKNTYLIGVPGVKYYPHQILQELLYYLHNDFAKEFYCNKYFVNIIDNPVINIDQQIHELIIECNLKSIFIAPILDDPLKNYVLPFGINDNQIQEEIKKDNKKSIVNILSDNVKEYVDNVIKNNKIYQYKYFMNDYYLTSFCVAENIPNSNISFHCVFIQIKYDYDFNIVGINRYDDSKLDYLDKEDEKNTTYLPYERVIFHKDHVTDYYDTKHNYKICLLCYTKKTIRSNEY